MLKFTGNRAQLHQQLKEWCEENDKKMTGTIMELIKSHLKKVNKKI
jgi:hypothetical protein